MTDYTPTTEEVYRAHWRGTPMRSEDGLREHVALDRWLAEHGRQVAERVWEEGETDGEWNYQNQYRIARGGIERITNPYRQGETE